MSKFKIGDRVAVYGANESTYRETGVIFEETNLMKIPYSPFFSVRLDFPINRKNDRVETIIVHPKQCRRLKPTIKSQDIILECCWELSGEIVSPVGMFPNNSGWKSLLGKKTKISIEVIE